VKNGCLVKAIATQDSLQHGKQASLVKLFGIIRLQQPCYKVLVWDIDVCRGERTIGPLWEHGQACYHDVNDFQNKGTERTVSNGSETTQIWELDPSESELAECKFARQFFCIGTIEVPYFRRRIVFVCFR
jgi:hypothetical protein